MKDIKSIKAIDLHSHLNHGAEYDCLQNETAIHKANLNFLKEMYSRANIEMAVFSTFSAVLHTEEIVQENEYLHELALKDEKVFQWVVVDPRQDKTFEQADRMLDSHKCLGLKIMPGTHQYDMKEYGDKIFSFANERKTTILIHPTCRHRDECELADKYPEMKLILAHHEGQDHTNAILFSVNGNVYTDTSGGASVKNNFIEDAVRQAGSTHIFFGTDTYASGFQRGRIEYAGITYEDKVNILRDNALRVFAKNFKDFKK